MVTATRTEEPAREVPAAISTIGRAEWEKRGALFIGDELAQIPGLTLQRNDSGTYTSLTLRGVPNRIHNDTLLALVDGIPMVAGDDEIDLEQIPYDATERVDVLRGPSSSLYGRGAVSGTLNYLTRSIPNTTTVSAGTTYGSWDYRKFEASAALDGKVLLLATDEHGGGWRDHTARDGRTFFGKTKIDLGDNATLTLWGARMRADQDLAGELPVDANARLLTLPNPRGRQANYNEDDAGFAKRITYGTAILDWKIADGVTLTTKLHRRGADTTANQAFYRGYDPATFLISFTGFSVHADDNTWFGEQQMTWRTSNNRLVAGLSAERINARHVETWTGEFDFGALFYTKRRDVRTGAYVNQGDWISDHLLDAASRETALAAYLEDEFRPLPWLRLTAGARLDHFSRNVEYGPTATGFGPNPPANAHDQDRHLSPKASVGVRLVDGVEAYASYGEAFSPGFGPIWSFINRATDTRPETARNYELGVKWSAGAFDGAASVYRLDRHDLIQLITDGPSARTVNAGAQRSEGFELETRWRPDTAWTVALTYALTRARWIDDRFFDSDLGQNFDFSGKRVAGVPRHAGSVSVERRFDAINVSLRGWVEAQGDYAVDNPNSVTAGGFWIANATAIWRPVERLDLQATVRNLFDRSYAQLVGGNLGPTAAFPQLPRAFLVQARWRF
ncbi:TonB-dependent siderophore receptor [Roseiterribacter gracilis]|uniref:TonB-dependent siderophore receptor n=1 Tax=Roseiterribacter gracilis TaxID=2812848 RepID=UPI003B4334F9